MSEFLIHYHKVSPTTWLYLSSLLLIGLFFKFSRFWSVRNLDLFLLILLGPGLLLAHIGHERRLAESEASAVAVNANTTIVSASETESSEVTKPSAQADTSPEIPSIPRSAFSGATIERYGYILLFLVGGLLLIRLLVDSMMVRRPLLAPNLSVGGLAFIGCALFIFLMANVVAIPPPSTEASEVVPSEQGASAATLASHTGPGYAVLNVLPLGATKIVAISSHLLVVLGLTLVGYWHFNNITMGIGAATLYLMLPYTSQLTARVDHVLPAAFFVWAILCYRQPLTAGLFLGLASGVVYYPLFLLPLWISFYWQRGFVRFVIGVASMLVLLAVILAFSPGDAGYWTDLRRMFGILSPRMEGLEGIWNPVIGPWDPAFRLPVLAAFVTISGSLALWPAQKNLGTLLSCSAAVMLGTQFWHGDSGGTYMAWYLPLTLLTVFRPNLEDRVALSVLGDKGSGLRLSVPSPVRAA